MASLLGFESWGADAMRVQVFQAIARDVMLRLQDTQASSATGSAPGGAGTVSPNRPAAKPKKSGCC